MAQVANWVLETCSTVGTGDLILTGPVEASENVTFSASLPAGEVWYSIQEGSNREAGIGTFDGSNTIARTTIHTSKTGNTYNTNPSPISLSGQAVVSCTLNAAGFVSKVDKAGDTMTGPLIIDTNGASGAIILRQPDDKNFSAVEIVDNTDKINSKIYGLRTPDRAGFNLFDDTGTLLANFFIESDGNVMSEPKQGQPVPAIPTNVQHLTPKGYTDAIASHVSPPATATSAGTTGNIAMDAGFFYVCTATNVWKRVAIGSW